ncbi:MAG: hypothetical protein KCHDKBKB_02024 [Elusimicrobia bacterium]|nr:hypothetical protein [Elusimicrobiota bacterium]
MVTRAVGVRHPIIIARKHDGMAGISHQTSVADRFVPVHLHCSRTADQQLARHLKLVSVQIEGPGGDTQILICRIPLRRGGENNLPTQFADRDISIGLIAAQVGVNLVVCAGKSNATRPGVGQSSDGQVPMHLKGTGGDGAIANGTGAQDHQGVVAGYCYLHRRTIESEIVERQGSGHIPGFVTVKKINCAVVVNEGPSRHREMMRKTGGAVGSGKSSRLQRESPEHGRGGSIGEFNFG